MNWINETAFWKKSLTNTLNNMQQFEAIRKTKTRYKMKQQEKVDSGSNLIFLTVSKALDLDRLVYKNKKSLACN